MTNTPPVIVWFRQDLRLGDNPALSAAAKTGSPVLPVYIWDTDAAGEWAMGGAARVWLHGSLQALDAQLASVSSKLLLQAGKTAEILLQLAQDTGARQIHCNARYEPWALSQEQQVKSVLAEAGVTLSRHTGGTLLWEPESVATQQGKPYQVFTPYFNRCLSLLPEIHPLPAPVQLIAPAQWPDALTVEALRLLPTIPWDAEMRALWKPGEVAAMQRVQTFLQEAVAGYPQARDIPSQRGTSRFSPHLAHGEISPRQIWQAVEVFSSGTSGSSVKSATATFLREIVWREFAYHVLFHFPHTTNQPLKEKFRHLPWAENADWLKRWGQGQTGYPLVDAGMRQLWRTGWMHNRVRMVVGSFLTKDLLIPWQDGARWFWDTLVDADLAINSMNWQWVAGCGADAQPFFRIFNPVSQSEKFDPAGAYIRQWVPELAPIESSTIHAPWQAKPLHLQLAGMQLGETYPHPIVDHAEARSKALMLYKQIGESSSPTAG